MFIIRKPRDNLDNYPDFYMSSLQPQSKDRAMGVVATVCSRLLR